MDVYKRICVPTRGVQLRDRGGQPYMNISQRVCHTEPEQRK